MSKKRISIMVLCLVLLFAYIVYDKQQKENYNYKIVDNCFSVKEDNSSSNHSFPCTEVEIISDVSSCIAIIQNNIVYYNWGSDDNSAIFYKYDMDTDKTYKLGEIQNVNIFSGRTAQIGDRLYFYITRRIGMGGGDLEASLYEMDITNNSLDLVSTEMVYQTLVYIDVLDNNIISYKGQSDGVAGTTYIDSVKVDGNIPEEKDPDIITKFYYDNYTHSGEVIHNFAQSNGFVYTINVIAGKMERLYIIKKFDSKGKHLTDIKLGQDIQDLISNEIIARFEVIGDYAFIRNVSGFGVLCDISGDTAQPKLISMSDLDLAFYPFSEKDPQYALFFNRETGKICLLDVNGGCISEIDTDYDHVRYIDMDNGSNTAFITVDNIISVDVTKLQVKNTYKTADMKNALVY